VPEQAWSRLVAAVLLLRDANPRHQEAVGKEQAEDKEQMVAQWYSQVEQAGQ
jgi:hypothetical protein